MKAGPLRIDLRNIVNKRLGARAKWVPAFLLHGLERIIHQEELNRLLDAAYPAEGSEFSLKILKELDIRLDVRGLEKLPVGEAFEFVCNHPLGGLDGIALVGVLGKHYGDENIRVLVNDMLMNVEPLKKVFLPVNKYGTQGRTAAKAIGDAYSSGKQIVMFPAGLVSRKQSDGSIRDLAWQKSCVVKALASGRRIVPVRFEGLNSSKFYNLAYWRKRLHIGINLEQALLPSELCGAKGSTYSITFGDPIDVSEMRSGGMLPQDIAAELRKRVYSL